LQTRQQDDEQSGEDLANVFADGDAAILVEQIEGAFGGVFCL
jgi:hypothetical protein